MQPISIVIITCNESHHILDCIASAKLLSDDIIVVDAGSEDDTVVRAKRAGARVITVEWKNYGSSRNIGAAAATHNWIFALDADERITNLFARGIMALPETGERCIYRFRRESYFAGKKIRFGIWGRDRVYRLYDRRFSQWDISPVHEKLLMVGLRTKSLRLSMIHFPVRKTTDYSEKIKKYSALSAQKYLLQRKSSNWVKRRLAPVFVFLQSYLFLLGFLDGKEGLIIARQLAWYTRLKYLILANLQKHL